MIVSNQVASLTLSAQKLFLILKQFRKLCVYTSIFVNQKFIEMKKVLLLTTIAALFMACGSPDASTEAGDAKETAVATESSTSYTIDVEKSTLEWLGGKVGGSTHTGTINLVKGSVQANGSSIESGGFAIDMNSIAVTDDLPEEKKAYLVGHLAGTTGTDKDADFFQVKKYPTASFDITSNTADSLTGNLTIVGVAKSITIPYTASVEGDTLSASSTFSIDRTQWGIKYGSGSFIDNLGDDAINDAIEFKINLVGAK